ncbi:MAG: M23 family metallopeptidase [Helicobacteraceae bacterium]|nr:M23 family metallopeptidase [Helicobacteraceae bacterium]
MIRSILIACLSSSALFANLVSTQNWPANRSFYDYLVLNRIDPILISELDEDSYEVVRTILADTTFYEHREEETDRLLHALIPISEEQQISLYYSEGGYKLEIVPVRYAVVRETLTTRIQSSLQADLIGITGNSRLAHEITAIFDDRVDFRRDVHKNDPIGAIYLRKVRLGKTWGSVTVESAFIETNGKRRYAFYYPEDEGYYDEKGNALAGLFLKYPLKFIKITSEYQPTGRQHPIYGQLRPHLGVDFGASAGTPIYTVAEGVVRFAGCQRACSEGYGKQVVIEHKNGWQSRYAHLQNFASKVTQGTRVSQGQTVGYVGKTGVTTGYHLHFEMRRNGQTTNPLAIKNVRQDGLNGKDLSNFLMLAEKWRGDLDYYADIAEPGVNRISLIDAGDKYNAN